MKEKNNIEKLLIRCLARECDNEIAKFLSQGFCGVCYSNLQIVM